MILVSGYYGCHNSGDEAILAALCQDLAALGVSNKEITVLSGDPAHTESTHHVAAISRFNPLAMIDAMGHSRILISGGGSLLQDATSWRTIPYYLTIIKTAVALGLKVVIYGQGIGPVKNRLYQRWIADVFNQADGIAVRDSDSAQLLQKWGLDTGRLLITADPVFSLEHRHDGPENPTGSGITINLRPYRHWERDYPHWISLIKSWLSAWQTPVRFAALGPGDRQIGLMLARAIPKLEVIAAEDWRSALHLMGQTEVSVSMRLHGMIFAALGGSLPIGIDYDPKVKVLGSQLQVPVCPAVPDIRLTKAIGRLLADPQPQRKNLARRVEELRRRSEQNRALISTVL
ncbi:MAG TPA: polysaccharide pyruvyl transferase CsaB [Limnochordia bacterium]|jgi:polysaccharide pyruvyl transferase CsaB|nr:polysaccharide pyruvyl transferase CsaB [Bacillota bacterium]HKM17809.1 polysaccharide pyruvyl transferase CsaB [Limnochordia bacterium]